MHQTLERQLKHIYGSIDKVPPGIKRLLEVVGNTYDSFDKDRRLIDRSLEISSRELEAAKNKSETLLASIADGVFGIDKERNIVYLNPQAEALSGYKASEVIGKPYYDFLKFIKEKDRSENIEFIRTALKGEVAEIADPTVLIRKDKGELPVADSASPIKDKEGNILGVIVVFRDATKQRKIEQMRKEMISLTSHQLKGPLIAIRGFADLLNDRDISSEAKGYLNKIDRSAKTMAELIGEILDISKIEQGSTGMKTKPTQFEEVVESVIKDLSSLSEKRKVTVEFVQPSEPLGKVNVDPIYIRQAIENIVSNAIKYTKNKVTLSLGALDGKLQFSCADNGIGIPQDEQSHIFTKFYRASNAKQTSTEGTGLGLSIVQAILEKSGGRVYFESKEGKGTTFYVTLPLPSG